MSPAALKHVAFIALCSYIHISGCLSVCIEILIHCCIWNAELPLRGGLINALCRLLAQIFKHLFRASCLMLERKEFRCYEVKMEGNEKTGSHWDSNPGHLCLEPPVLRHWGTTAEPPPALIILCSVTECLSRTPGRALADSQQLPAFLLSSIFA